MVTHYPAWFAALSVGALALGWWIGEQMEK